jgi:hypothetical protein
LGVTIAHHQRVPVLTLVAMALGLIIDFRLRKWKSGLKLLAIGREKNSDAQFAYDGLEILVR